MKNTAIKPFVLMAILIVAACSGGGGDDPTPPPTGGNDDDPVVIPDPSAATLIFPEDDSECNEGEALSDTESNVTFQWNVSQNTDSYSVTLTNLNTNQSFNTNSNTNEAFITLQRGTPYEWSVTSRANGTNATAQSPTWRFYNEGSGTENYAPFPAEAINPVRGATLASGTTSVTLEWSATDVDDDIIEYEVFFGPNDTDTTPSLGITTSTSFNVDVQNGQIYVWSIETIDDEGNSSVSEDFLFRVDE